MSILVIGVAGVLVDMVKETIPTAQIRFDPDLNLFDIIDKLFLSILELSL